MLRVPSPIGPCNDSSALRAGALLSLAALSSACSSNAAGSSSAAPGVLDGGASGTGGLDANTADVIASSCAGKPVAWLDDGVVHCASSATGTLGQATYRGVDGGNVTQEDLEIVILQSNPSSIFSLIVGGPAPLGGDDYSCSLESSSLVQISYHELGDGGFSTTPASCTVSVTLRPDDGGVDGGSVATGTFSAVLNVSGGGTKALSQGAFTVFVTSE